MNQNIEIMKEWHKYRCICTLVFWLSTLKLLPGVATTIAAEVLAAVTGGWPTGAVIFVCIVVAIVELLVGAVPFVTSVFLPASLPASMASALRFRPIVWWYFLLFLIHWQSSIRQWNDTFPTTKSMYFYILGPASMSIHY